MDREGRIVRQETPMGWTMEACAADEAIAWMGDREATRPELLSVPGAGRAGRAGWGAAFEKMKSEALGAGAVKHEPAD